jgi:hypothetical protein
MNILHRSCAQAVEDARQARDTAQKNHNAQLDVNAAVDVMTRQLLKSVSALEDCLQSVVGRSMLGATDMMTMDMMTMDMSIDSLVNGQGTHHHDAKQRVAHVRVTLAQGEEAARETVRTEQDTSRHIADELCQASNGPVVAPHACHCFPFFAPVSTLQESAMERRTCREALSYGVDGRIPCLCAGAQKDARSTQ